MKNSIISCAIAIIALIGMTNFTIEDNHPNNIKDDNQITVSVQSQDGRIPIQSGGKTVGYLEWSKVKYVSQTMVLKIYNDSDEFIRGYITGKRADSCDRSYKLGPYKEDEIYFYCSDNISDFSISVYVD